MLADEQLYLLLKMAQGCKQASYGNHPGTNAIKKIYS